MKEPKERIEQLLERYFDGLTTEAEERRLSAWSRGEGVPEELRVLFGGLEALAGETMPPRAIPATRHTLRGRRLRTLWGVAAAAAVVLGVVLCTEWLRRPYCYIDGVAIYDREVALQTTGYFAPFEVLDTSGEIVDELLENN